MKQYSLFNKLLKTGVIGGAFCLATITATAEPYFSPFAPNGTHIQYAGGIDDITVTCDASDTACATFLSTLDSSGSTITLRQGPDNLSATFSAEDGSYDSSTNQYVFPSASLPADLDNWPRRGEWWVDCLNTGNQYPEVHQWEEAWVCAPIEGKCQLNSGNGDNFTISCEAGFLDTILHAGSELFIQGTQETSGKPNFYRANDLQGAHREGDTITFDTDLLRNRGYSIPEGNYYVSLLVREGNSSKNIKLNNNSTVHFNGVTGKAFPSNVAITSDPTSKDITITCDLNENTCIPFLNDLYEMGNELHQNQHQLTLQPVTPGPSFWFPHMPDKQNYLEKVSDETTGKTIAIKISADTVNNVRNIPNGTEIKAVKITLDGYEGNYYRENSDINLVIYSDLLTGDVSYEYDQNTYFLTVKVPETEDAESRYRFLHNLSGLSFQNKAGGPGKGVAILEDKKEYTEDGKSVIIKDLQNLHLGYSAAGTGEVTVTTTATGFAPRKNDVTIQHPFKKFPARLQVTPVGFGFIIRDLDKNPSVTGAIANGVPIPGITTYLYLDAATPGGVRIMGDAVSVTRSDTTELSPSFEFTRITDDGDDYVKVVASWDKLVAAGADASKYYYIDLYDTYYGNALSPSELTWSLNPIILAYAAEHPEEFTYEELERLNQLAVTTADGGLQNVQVNQTVNKQGDVSSGVDVAGEVAGALTASDTVGEADIFDLNNEEKSDLQVDVVTTIEDLDSDETQEIIDQLSEYGTVEKTGIGFTITVKKKYTPNDAANWFAKYKRKQGLNEISEFPYPIALRFPLPDKPLKTGKKYTILREHKGFVEELIEGEDFEIDYENGYIIVYSDKFSSFVLVETDKKTDPAPSSNSSKKSTSAKTDNVVTCQMAGYPANYAWNEAAKACQPGYLDANGVFRSTARAGVPNTYDKGLKGSVISLVTATVFAFFAAVLLKKY